jgi:thiamine-monophosphate kinase
MNKRVHEIGEFGLIDALKRWISKLQGPWPKIPLGIGDDASVIDLKEGLQLAITCDSFVEGRHFPKDLLPPHDIGWRVMTANISDLAAMGAVPRYALISLGIPPHTPISWVRGVYRGALETLRPFGATIVGGNVTSVDAQPFIDVTLLGEVERGLFLTRSGARTGDEILVTGFPGQASLGLKIILERGDLKGLRGDPLVRSYLRPQGRVLEGLAAARSGLATAMIDISDGLLGDLAHLCEQSGVGAEIWAEKLPLSPRMKREAGCRGADPCEFVLGPSDDYELIITCEPLGASRLARKLQDIRRVRVTSIGRITDRAGRIEVILKNGKRTSPTWTGWDHFKG